MTGAAARHSPIQADVPGSAAPGLADRCRVFDFQHRIFQVEGCHFALSRDLRDPLFHMPLGDVVAAIPIGRLRKEFGIAETSHDGHLLAIVEKSLRYVKEIRTGDTIPHELLDGTASWSVGERQRRTAQYRLAVQAVTWAAGAETVITDLDQLEQIAEDPATERKLEDAYEKLAARLDLGADGAREVERRLNVVARELSYIEGLRDRYAVVRALGDHFARMLGLYRRESAVRDDLLRMQTLIRTPQETYETIFAQVDAQTGEIVTVLRKMDAIIAFVRDARDDLHAMLIHWSDMADRWANAPAEPCPEAETLIRETYQFLARLFPQVSEWQLATRR